MIYMEPPGSSNPWPLEDFGVHGACEGEGLFVDGAWNMKLPVLQREQYDILAMKRGHCDLLWDYGERMDAGESCVFCTTSEAPCSHLINPIGVFQVRTKVASSCTFQSDRYCR
jgi:hypothetical protein